VLNRTRTLAHIGILLGITAVPALSGAPVVDPGSFRTNAAFSVDSDSMNLTSAVATIEPRLGAPGYSWLRITFYSYPVSPDDLPALAKGDTASMDKKWKSMSSSPKDYNTSHASIQLTVDQNEKIWQVDMAIPGHGCTIAPFEPDVKAFLQDYQFDGTNLRLKSKGSYACDMKFMGKPDQKFSWDFDLHAVVFKKIK